MIIEWVDSIENKKFSCFNIIIDPHNGRVLYECVHSTDYAR